MVLNLLTLRTDRGMFDGSGIASIFCRHFFDGNFITIAPPPHFNKPSLASRSFLTGILTKKIKNLKKSMFNVRFVGYEMHFSPFNPDTVGVSFRWFNLFVSNQFDRNSCLIDLKTARPKTIYLAIYLFIYVRVYCRTLSDERLTSLWIHIRFYMRLPVL